MYEKITRWPGRTLAALVVLFLGIGAAPALGEPTGVRDALGGGGARLLVEWPGGVPAGAGQLADGEQPRTVVDHVSESGPSSGWRLKRCVQEASDGD
ncbi:hypothetical protein, partial [Streptomyces acidiscabies]|uniref:hypothetical protein n=1 Tax=Streptomyces acidiscabies TaxID=42234 RepID=UPI001C4DBFD5